MFKQNNERETVLIGIIGLIISSASMWIDVTKYMDLNCSP